MSGEIRPGYKLTEVGVIPEDWGVQPLKSLSERITVGIASAATHAYRKEGVPLLRNQNIKSGYLDDQDLLYIDPDYEQGFKNKRLRPGDVLTARTGYPGTTCVVPKEYLQAQSFTTLITRPRKDCLNSYYLGYYINSECGQRFFEQSQIGGAQKNVNAGSLRHMLVPIPPLLEQNRISDVLSDIDSLISRLDQLIAKKRDIKQAAMQQLLTGQKRLPGFSGEWVAKSFSDVLIRINTKSYQIQASEYQATGLYPVIDQGKDLVVGYSDQSEKCFACPKEGVIVFGDHTCIVKFIDFGFIVGADGVQALSARHEQSIRFLAYKLEYSGITSTGYNRHFKLLKELEFLMPSLAEQTAIATLLSDMDAELAVLEQRRDKAKLLKQGMMQELLTGRIRLL